MEFYYFLTCNIKVEKHVPNPGKKVQLLTRAHLVHCSNEWYRKNSLKKYCFFSIKNSNTIMKGIGKDLKHFSRLKNTSLFQEKMQSLTRAHLMHCCNEFYRKNIIRYWIGLLFIEILGHFSGSCRLDQKLRMSTQNRQL